jgi:protease I
MAWAHVDIISLHAGRIRSVNLHEPASMVRVDKPWTGPTRRNTTGC